MRAWTRAVRPRLRLLSKGDTARDRLDARNDVGLAKGLIQLGPWSRGWIDFDNFMSLFGTEETYLPPSEWDPDGQREVSEFALAYDCSVCVVDRERRVYFVKNALEMIP
jgi:hypothetical protein